MAKKVKLTETQIEKAINEISYGTVSNARDANFDMFNDLFVKFLDYQDKLDDLKNAFGEFEPSLYQNRNFNIYKTNSNNPTMNKIYSLMVNIKNNIGSLEKTTNELNNILERKRKQGMNFDDSIMKAEENPNLDWTENYNDREIKDLQNY